MPQPLNILALQTARANSKSVVKKNLLPINDVPMFMISANAALNSNTVSHVACSTDDAEIKRVIQSHDRQDFVVVDVRTTSEYEPDHIPDALHIPVDELHQRSWSQLPRRVHSYVLRRRRTHR